MINSLLNRFISSYIIIISALTICNGQSIEYDKKIGAENAKYIESNMGLYHSEGINDFIRNVGSNLVKSLGKQNFNYRFYIVEMREPNAFALPGGYIYISRGLLSLTNTEDEVAGILGHEIIHSEFRHSIKQFRRRIIPGLVQIPGEVVGFVINENLENLINTPLNTGSKLFLASYSRKHEKQADKYGMYLMTKSGYNPSHFPVVLDNLSRLVEEITGYEEEFSYFDSHPYTPDRIKYLNQSLNKLEYPDTNASKSNDEFLNVLDGICVGQNPEYGFFEENNYYHPGLDLFMSFPKGWETDNKAAAVGAIDTTENQGIVVLGIASKDKSPEELGKDYLTQLKIEYNTNPVRAESVDLNGMPAYTTSVKDSTSDTIYGIHNLWFRYNNITYQVLGIAKEEDFKHLQTTAQSIRPLSLKEKENIPVYRLRIKETKEGENIEAFNKRTGNMWNSSITAIMNKLEPDVVFEKKQLLKVVLEEKYQMKKQ